jgi:DegV family protein with EDD domain
LNDLVYCEGAIGSRRSTVRVGLVVDSACDLPRDFIEENRIVVMPITINLGDRDLIDVRDTAVTKDFYTRHLGASGGAHTTPMTSAEMTQMFLDKLAVDYDYVFCLTIASSRSPIYENAMRASHDVIGAYKPVRLKAGQPGPFAVRVIDSQNLFAGQGVMAVEAVRMIKAGESPGKIRERLDFLAFNTHGYMLPRDLYYLRARGQKKGDKSVGWMQYAVGSALDIKPLIKGYRNETSPCARLRHFGSGAERLFGFVVTRVQRGLQAPVVVVSYGGDLADLDQLPGFNALRVACKERHVDLMISVMSVTGAINVGEGALAVAFADEPHEFA